MILLKMHQGDATNVHKKAKNNRPKSRQPQKNPTQSTKPIPWQSEPNRN